MQETIDTARELLGKQLIVVFQTAPMYNNVCDKRGFKKVSRRHLIRSFVIDTMVMHRMYLLLSDVEVYMDNANAWNVQQMGMTTTNSNS